MGPGRDCPGLQAEHVPLRRLKHEQQESDSPEIVS